MAWAYVANASQGFNAGSSVNGCQFSSNTVVGNTILACCSWGNATAGSTYTDSQGNVYTVGKEINDGTNGQSASAAYAVSISGATLSSVVGHHTAGSGFEIIVAAEYSGISAFDVAAGNIGLPGSTATDNVNSTLATTTVNNDLLWGVAVDYHNGSTNTISAGTGFTQRLFIENLNHSTLNVHMEDMNQAASGSTRCRWSQKQAHNYLGLMLAMKQTAAGGAGPRVIPTLTLVGVQ